MIGTIAVKVNAARPNMPLDPVFSFKGSPSSLRIMDVPKGIGKWTLNAVKVIVKYPDDTTITTNALRNGSVWVATFEGNNTVGKSGSGYKVVADGLDENGNDVTGYVLGVGDLYVLDNDTNLEPLVDKSYVKYCASTPSTPMRGDLIVVVENENTLVKIYDGTEWKSQTLFTKTSDLVNDSGFITTSAIPSSISAFENDVGYITTSAIPTNVTAFNNDAGYITVSAIPSDISAFQNDVGYITASALPTNISELENDVGYITSSAIPSNVGAFANDAGYITESAIPSSLGAFYNDVGYLTSVSWGEVLGKPSNLSDFNNDVGFITASAIPQSVSSFVNDVGYITSSAIPSSISAFENDVGYLTSVSWSDIQNKPSQVSDFENDAGYITTSAIPSNVSDFTNDAGYLTSVSWNDVGNKPSVALVSDLPSNVSELTNDAGYITASAIPSNVSSFENDAGYITASALPSNVSELNNDSGFITASAVPSNVSEFNNDVGYLSAVSWNDIQNKPAIPSTTNDLTNNSGFITSSAIPSNVTAFNNDAGYITASAIPAIPSETSDLTNDSGFITAAAIPSNISSFNNDVGYITSANNIVDSDENRIRANRTTTVMGEESGLVFYDSVRFGYIDRLNINDVWHNADGTVFISQNPEGSEYVWHLIITNYHYDQNVTVNAEGDFNPDESIDWSSGNYYFVRNVLFRRVSGIVKKAREEHLATQEWVVGQSYATQSAVSALVASMPSAVSDLANDLGFVTASAIPSTLGAFTNDVGYVTASQVPTPSFIQDEDENKIEADLSTHQKTSDFNWYVDGVKGSPDNSFYGASYTPSDPQYNGWVLHVTEGSSMPDAYDITVNWTSYVNGEWIEDSTMFQGLLPVGETEFTADGHTARMVYKYEDGKLATKEYVDSLVAQLNARISALENN